MIGQNIKRIRKQRLLTLSELAGRANIAKSYLSNIERNVNQNPSIQFLEKIAAVLDVDVKALIETERTDEHSPENEWLLFIKALKESGIDANELVEYRTVIEFIKWQNRSEEKTDEKGEVKNGN